MICTLTDGFDAATVERIQARLDEVERDHGVRVLWAVKSGSRAWGFPSPDSDCDCRFSTCAATTTTCRRDVRGTSPRLPWTMCSTSMAGT